MIIITDNSQDRPIDDNTACALGFFDGVHKGHVELISKLKELSHGKELKSMIFTFEKHPLTILSPDYAPKLITNNEMKLGIFEDLGVDIVNLSSVSPEFLSIEPGKFLSEVLIKKFNVKAITAGFNFRFGHLGAGDSNYLRSFCQSHNMPVRIVEPFIIDGSPVSSTAIREYIKSGDILMANKLLGRPFALEGNVSHGMMRGRGLGFPTANLIVDEDIITPKNGVYVTSVNIDGKVHAGVTNVGFNPTFNNSNITVETHIIDFTGDIYGKKIKVFFYKRLRGEIKFNNITELSNQIQKDKQTAINTFSHK